MILKEDVFQEFSQFVVITTENKERADLACSHAADLLSTRLKSVQHGKAPLVVRVASLYALTSFLALEESLDGGVKSFKVGDVTIQNESSKGRKQVQELYKEALQGASAFFVDDTFFFLGV